MANDYTSAATLLAAQKAQANDKSNSELFQALLSQGNQRKMLDTQGQQHMSQIAATGDQTRQSEAAKQQGAFDTGQKALDLNTDRLTGLIKGNPGMGGTVDSNGNISLTKPVSNGALDFRMSKNIDDKTEKYSKRLEPVSGFLSTMQELEDKTNRDGKGGILTNPDAKLMSTGKLLSAMPDALVGFGEYFHGVPKGTMDERKALSRLQLEYQKATAGMRQTDELRKKETAAMGMLTSGDPDLVAKGVRSIGHALKQRTDITKMGYAPEVLDRANERFGDPTEFLGKVYNDDKPVIAKQPPAGGGGVTPAAAGGLTPEQQAELEQLRSERAKHKGQ
jgi:hypothetical protein